MKRFCVALLSASLWVATPATAQTSPSQVKSLQLSKVIVDTKTTPIEARVKGGTLCVFPTKIEMPEEKETLDYDRVENLFADEMQERGFAVVNSSGDLFSSESQEKGDLLVGGTMVPEEINICSSIKGFKGTIKVNVEWQIFDRSTQTVVETVRTFGEGKLEKFDHNGYAEMWNLAFVAALRALTERHVFEKYVGSPTRSQVAEIVPASDVRPVPAN